jgi:hypothetical protein
MQIQPRCDHRSAHGHRCPDAGGYFPVVETPTGAKSISVALYCKRHRRIRGAVRYFTIAQAKKIRVAMGRPSPASEVTAMRAP